MHRELAGMIRHAKENSLLFQDVMTTIRRHYECVPVAFSTGVGTSIQVDNAAGTNAASCALLAFAKSMGLAETTTLGLYGEHYRAVLDDPAGSAHGNIRAFMANGWQGVRLDEGALRLKGPG